MVKSKLCTNLFIDWNCFKGERCGPWASCLSPLQRGHCLNPLGAPVVHTNSLSDIYRRSLLRSTRLKPRSLGCCVVTRTASSSCWITPSWCARRRPMSWSSGASIWPWRRWETPTHTYRY